MTTLENYSKNLLVPDIKFLLVHPNKKGPIGLEWQTGKTAKTITQIDEINKHIQKEGNLGILLDDPYIDFEIEGPAKCGSQEIFNELINIAKKLPETLTIKTPSGGERRIYRCSEVSSKVSGEIEINGQKFEPIEIRGRKCQSLIYGSVEGNKYEILNDKPISEINITELYTFFNKYLPQKEVQKPNQYENKKIDLSIDKVINLSSLQQNGNEYFGPHPVHGAKSGHNFSANPTKGTWVCFNHNTGGDALMLLAVKEGIISCSDCRPGALDKDKFKKVLEIAKRDYGATILENNNLELSDVPTMHRVSFSEFDKIFENTDSHLDAFGPVNNFAGLRGSSYYAPIKALSYYMESMRQPTISFKVGRETFDNRINMLMLGGAGSGKGKIKGVIRQHPDTIEPSVGSSLKLDQLIGKKVFDKISKQEETKPGYLGSKGIVFDESQKLLTEDGPGADECMRELRIAMDPYKTNEVQKKLVDNATPLAYFPTARMALFTHDIHFPPIFFDTGTFRRFFAFELENVDTTESELVASLYDSWNGQELKDFIQDSSLYADIELNKDAIDEAAKWYIAWVKFCVTHPNQRIRMILYRMMFSVKQYLFRNIAILAISKKERCPSIRTVKYACFDTIQFLMKTYEIYANKSSITLSRDTWMTDKPEEAMFFEWLYYNNALSQSDSKILISSAQDKIRDIFGVNERQSRQLYSSFKKRGLIDDYKGQHESKCWLAFIPRLEKNIKFNITENEKPFIEFLKEEKELMRLDVQLGQNTLNIVTPEITLVTPETIKPKYSLIDGELKISTCSLCGDEKQIVAKKENGEHVCEKCYENIMAVKA